MKLLLTLAFLIPAAFSIAQDNAYHGDVKPGDLNFAQTVKLINTKLVEWCEKGNVVTVTAQPNGEVRIKNKRKQTMIFNLVDLTKKGVNIRSCDIKSHAPLSWIDFETVNGNAAFIRLQCKMPRTELELLRDAFLRLTSLSTKK